MSSAEPEKYDMFDVARGTCTLEDFLLNRFTTQELEKKIQVDPQAGFSEHIAPPKPPSPSKLLFPIPATSAKSLLPTLTHPSAAPTAPAALSPSPGSCGHAPAPDATPMEAADIQKLIAGFYSAAQDYTQRVQWEEPPASPGKD